MYVNANQSTELCEKIMFISFSITGCGPLVITETFHGCDNRTMEIFSLVGASVDIKVEQMSAKLGPQKRFYGTHSSNNRHFKFPQESCS